MVRMCLALFVLAVMARHLTFAMETETGLSKRITRLENEVEEINHRLEDISDQLKPGGSNAPLVAFSAYHPIDEYAVTNRVIRFGVYSLNEGDHYNPETGIFTAPFDGLYQFSAHICNWNGAYIVFAIICNENELAVSTQWDDTLSCGSVNALGIVKAGGKVSVKCTFCANDTQMYENVHRRNSFTGVLLQKK